MTDQLFNKEQDNPSIQDLLLDNSRITPAGSGSLMNKMQFNQPTGGQKWWAAVILGFIFALISSPPAYSITSTIRGVIHPTYNKEDHYQPNLYGLFIHTIIFIIVVRIILW